MFAGLTVQRKRLKNVLDQSKMNTFTSTLTPKLDLAAILQHYEVKLNDYFSKRKVKYFYNFNHFYSEKSSKRAK